MTLMDGWMDGCPSGEVPVYIHAYFHSRGPFHGSISQRRAISPHAIARKTPGAGTLEFCGGHVPNRQFAKPSRQPSRGLPANRSRPLAPIPRRGPRFDVYQPLPAPTWTRGARGSRSVGASRWPLIPAVASASPTCTASPGHRLLSGYRYAPALLALPYGNASRPAGQQSSHSLVQSIAARRPCCSRSRFAGPAGRLFVGSQTLGRESLPVTRQAPACPIARRSIIIEPRPLDLTRPSPREQRQQRSHLQPRSSPRASFCVDSIHSPYPTIRPCSTSRPCTAGLIYNRLCSRFLARDSGFSVHTS